MYLSVVTTLIISVLPSTTPAETSLKPSSHIHDCVRMLLEAKNHEVVEGLDLTAIAKTIVEFRKSGFATMDDPALTQEQLELNFGLAQTLMKAESDLRTLLMHRPTNSSDPHDREVEGQLAALRFEIRGALRNSVYSKLMHEKFPDISKMDHEEKTLVVRKARDRYYTLLSWLPRDSYLAQHISELIFNLPTDAEFFEFGSSLEVTETADQLDTRLNFLAMSETRLIALYKVHQERNFARAQVDRAQKEVAAEIDPSPAIKESLERALAQAKSKLADWQLVYDRHKVAAYLPDLLAYEKSMKASAEAQELSKKAAKAAADAAKAAAEAANKAGDASSATEKSE